MRIVIIGLDNFDSLEYHIKDELLNKGHSVEIFGFSKFISTRIDLGISLISSSYVESQNKKLLKKILTYEPDLVIGVYRHLHPLVVKGVKKNKIRIININPDALTTFQNQQLFVEPYDAYFTKDQYIFNFMRNKLNFNVKLYSEAYNPRIHKRPNVDLLELEKEINIEVLCFGSLYPYRNRMLRRLKELNVNLTLYGYRNKYFDSYLLENFTNKEIYGEEKAKILNGSKIVFNNFHYAEIESVNNKFFEINGSGAFQLCDYKPILKKLLPIDPKLVSFENINEAKKLINFYLDKPEKRFEIRDQIMNHFKENFTYEILINQILE